MCVCLITDPKRQAHWLSHSTTEENSARRTTIPALRPSTRTAILTCPSCRFAHGRVSTARYFAGTRRAARRRVDCGQ